MTPDQWLRLQHLLEEAAEQPASEQKAFVLAACPDDLLLREELLALLDASARSPETHEPPTAWLGAVAEPTPPRFEPGDRVAARYRIDRLLGRGGMGDVYAAWDEELSIEVALKTLHLADDTEEARRRLQIEGLLARSIWHANVCRLYDLVHHVEDGRSTWLLSMELLRGPTLAEVLKAEGALASERARHLAEQMAMGLAAAHRAGVVHRDFKPGNVVLVQETTGERAVVADFGIAQELDPANSARAAASIIGTRAYMAPEQLRGEPSTIATDIFALGVVLFEMVTGALPFEGAASSWPDLRDTHPPLPALPELDRAWATTLRGCLQHRPERRFAGLDQVIGTLPPTSSSEPTLPEQTSTYRSLRDRDSFVGRERELTELVDSVESGTRVVAIVGAAGMGKTRLARHLVGRLHERGDHDSWFCDLTSAENADGFAAMVAQSLRVELGRGDPIEQIGRAIAARGSCLIVLDNAEDVVGIADDALRAWLSRAPLARFLVTSRKRLAIGAEHKELLLDALLPADSVELFRSRVSWLRPELSLDERDVQALVGMVDGMPLAIELAAARIRVMTLPEIVRQMQRRFSLLTGGATERHETLLGTIEDSWEILAHREQLTFAQCSVFQDGFTLEAAEGVVALDECGVELLPSLQALVDRSLLRTTMRSSGTGTVSLRFGMLASLHEYARMQLRAAPEVAPDGTVSVQSETPTLDRHSAWYGAHAHAIEEAADASGNAWSILMPEVANLSQACRHAIAGGMGACAASAYRGLWSCFARTGPYASAMELGTSILDTLELSTSDKGKTLLVLANAERYAGLARDAMYHVRAAIEVFAASADPAYELKARDTFARLLVTQGSWTEAREEATSALELSRDLRDRRMEGFLLSLLGELDHRAGRIEDATQQWNEGLAVAREINDPRMEAILLNNLGNAHYGRGKLTDAERCFEAARSLHQSSGDVRGMGIALANLGQVHQTLGQLDQALACYTEALRHHRALGNRRFEASILADLGGLHRERGDRDSAHAHLGTALILHRELGDRESEGTTLLELSRLLEEEERLEEASTFCRASLAIHEEMRNAGLEAICRTLLRSLTARMERR